MVQSLSLLNRVPHYNFWKLYNNNKNNTKFLLLYFITKILITSNVYNILLCKFNNNIIKFNLIVFGSIWIYQLNNCYYIRLNYLNNNVSLKKKKKKYKLMIFKKYKIKYNTEFTS